MKKTTKRVLIGTGIFVALIVLLLLGYMLKIKSELKTMSPIETKEIVTNIFSIQDSFSNLFLIKDSDQYIAIDGGNNIDSVASELKKLTINPDKVTAVLLTHTDADHVASLKLFKNAKIYLSKQEEQLINGTKSRVLFFKNSIGTKEYSLIADQQILNIGNLQIKGYLTPGHTPGSMCYLINNKYLFTGDALSLKLGKIGKFNEFFNMDTPTAISSIAQITNIPEVQYIFTAHYGYSNDYKNAVKDWAK